jgi:glycosyltransferase involved in cell wall biosynthesis
VKLSVLIPCYDAARYLAEAVESALAQEVPLHEIVVVDDGSTDGTERLVVTFGGPVRYHRQTHAGIAAARNRALALSTGDLLAFLDADDVWPAGSLGARLAALEADATLEYVYGEVEQFVSPELPDEWARRHAAAISTPSSARLAGTMLVRRRVFDTVGGFRETLRIGETVDWVARADSLGNPKRSHPRQVLRRRLHATNTGLTRQDSRSDYLAVARAALARRRS